jgi:hypothetical protein
VSGGASEGGGGAALAAGEGLALAAAPTFAAMALVIEVLEDPAGLCLTAPAGPLSGMATMDLLMSLFHAPAWLRQLKR